MVFWGGMIAQILRGFLSGIVAFSFVGAALAQSTPSPWADLEKGDRYILEQEIILTGLRGERIVLLLGSDTVLKEVNPLDGISVVQYLFSPETCRAPKEESDMALVLPEYGKSGSEVGVQLRPHCMLEVFVETKDLAGASFYRER